MPTRTVADLMTEDVVTVRATEPVRQAAEAMRDHDIGDVVVVDDGRVSGVVTDRDLAVRVLAGRMDPSTTVVADVCTPNVVAAQPDTTIEEAVEAMRDWAVRRLPVVDGDGRPLGVVSIGDLAQVQDPHSALADISSAPPNS